MGKRLIAAVLTLGLELPSLAEVDGMPKEDNNHAFEGCEPSSLFRDFAAECIELAQAASSPEKRALYAKMASVWHQMAQRWETKS